MFKSHTRHRTPNNNNNNRMKFELNIFLFLLFVEFFAYTTVTFISAEQYKNPNGCGRRLALVGKDKIVGGSESQVGDWGWSVSLDYAKRHICGASILNENFILTAAHCLRFGLNPVVYGVSVGVHDRHAGQQADESNEPDAEYHQIAAIFIHPNYSVFTQQHDVALLKLRTPIGLNNRTKLAVCLNTDIENLSGFSVVAIGWGANVTGGQSISRKHEVTLKILPDSQCKSIFGLYFNAKIQICAGEKGSNQDTCQGDSGGPIVWQNPINKLYYQLGIVSYGQIRCGDGGVYARLDKYTEWIQNKISSPSSTCT